VSIQGNSKLFFAQTLVAASFGLSDFTDLRTNQSIMSLGNVLFVLIVFQLLFLSVYLFSQQKGKRISNRLLGFFFLAICLNLLDVFLLQTGVYFAHPGLAGLGSCLPLLFGPLLYFYTRSIIYKDFSVSIKNLIHFLPFLIVFCCTEIYYQSQPFVVQERILISLSEHRVPAIISDISTLIFLQFLCYAIAALRFVSLYKKMAGQHFSNPKYTDVSWLYSTIVFFILIIIISALNGVLAQTAFSKYYLFAFNLVVALLLLFVIQVMMRALSRPYFFSFGDIPETAGQLSKMTATEKAEKEATVQKLLKFMKSDKPYLDSELTLEQLATKLSLKPRVLSQAINDILQQNFFDFINRYRVDEAKALLTDPKNKKITVLEVLYQVGFNSKSSFNTLFKKYTSLTPTEFRKEQGK
jgi:AraC-like DNA-binding protein